MKFKVTCHRLRIICVVMRIYDENRISPLIFYSSLHRLSWHSWPVKTLGILLMKLFTVLMGTPVSGCWSASIIFWGRNNCEKAATYQSLSDEILGNIWTNTFLNLDKYVHFVKAVESCCKCRALVPAADNLPIMVNLSVRAKKGQIFNWMNKIFVWYNFNKKKW